MLMREKELGDTLGDMIMYVAPLLRIIFLLL